MRFAFVLVAFVATFGSNSFAFAEEDTCGTGGNYGVQCKIRFSEFHPLNPKLAQRVSGFIGSGPIVSISPADYTQKLEGLSPGTQVVLSSGQWKDVNLVIHGDNLVVRGQSLGAAVLTGKSRLIVKGAGNIVYGLKFQQAEFKRGERINGAIHTYLESNIFIRLGDETTQEPCNSCILSDIQIKDSGSLSSSDLVRAYTMGIYVDVYGVENTVAYSTFDGMVDRGHIISAMELPPGANRQGLYIYRNLIRNRSWPAQVISADANDDIVPNGYEPIQLGGLSYLNRPLYSVIQENVISKSDPEVSIITLKAGDVIVRGNTFFGNAGPVLFRAADRVLVDGNYFLGSSAINHSCGITISGEGHWIRNNYFAGNKKTANSLFYPIRLMPGMIEKIPAVADEKGERGIPRSKNVVISNNTLINNTQAVGWGVEFGRAVTADYPNGYWLPPQHVVFANNVISSTVANLPQIALPRDPGQAEAVFNGMDSPGNEHTNLFFNNVISASITGVIEATSPLAQSTRDALVSASEENHFGLKSLFTYNPDSHIYFPSGDSQNPNWLTNASRALPNFPLGEDALGQPRPAGGGNIGAIQTVAAPGSAPGAAPMNIRRPLRAADVGFGKP